MNPGISMTGHELYAKWENYRSSQKTRRPIGKSSLGQFEVVWGKWLAQCAGDGLRWDEATSEDVQKFLAAIAPRSKRGNPSTSTLTVNRYWRSLYELYNFAVISELVTSNPADLPKKPKAAEVLSLALTPQQWQALSDGLPGGFTPRERRTRLILLLTMRAALTVSELTELTVDNVKEVVDQASFAETAAESDAPLFQPESPHWKANEDHPTFSLTIESDKPERCRTLILDQRTSKAVADWLYCREHIGKDVVPPEGAKRYLIASGNGFQPMDTKAIYNICKSHFFKCLGKNTQIQHIGPNTLRNTCIKVWHSIGTPEATVMRRLGLKDPGALRRLKKHFEPSLSLQ